MKYVIAIMLGLNTYMCIHAMDISLEVLLIQRNGTHIIKKYDEAITHQLANPNIPLLYKQSLWLQFMDLQKKDHLILFGEKNTNAEAITQKLFDFKKFLEQYETLLNSIRRAQTSHNGKVIKNETPS